MKFNKTAALCISIIVPLAVGAIAGIITSPEIDGWYRSLRKPGFNPPDWIFGPVWTLLYITMGISVYLIWKINTTTELKKKAVFIFGLQLLFNFLWSILFFYFHLVFLALIDILILWGLILYMIYIFRKIKPTAGLMNIPYLLWVSFATALNISIWALNN